MKAIIGARYQHYKGNEYTIVTIARNEALPDEELVIYRAEYDSPDFGHGVIWARERNLFEGTLEHDGKTIERFTQIS